jgi:hypothetical protein
VGPAQLNIKSPKASDVYAVSSTLIQKYPAHLYRQRNGMDQFGIELTRKEARTKAEADSGIMHCECRTAP